MVNKKRLLHLIVVISFTICCIFLFFNWNRGLYLSEKVFQNSKRTSLDIRTEGTNVKIKNVEPIIKDYDNRTQNESIIPDKYNTGADLTKKMVTPEYYVKKGFLEKREKDYLLKLQSKPYDQEHITFRNVYFEDLPIYLANNNDKSSEGKIEFINCYFKQGVNLTTTVQKKLIFRNCDFLNQSVVAANVDFYSCKFYESHGDALQIAYNVRVQDCYIYDNGRGNPEKYHSDGIQIAGFGNTDAHNIRIDNVRIEMPRVAPYYGQNSALIVKMDLANGYDMEFKNMVLNGGAFTVYIVPTKFELKDLHFENLHIGTHSLYGPLYSNKGTGQIDGWLGQSVINTGEQKKVYVSSVINQKGKITFYATNETKRERDIRVETSEGEQVILVPPVLTVEEAKNAKASYDEMNIDLKYQVDQADWIKIYDGDELIRYKIFNSRD